MLLKLLRLSGTVSLFFTLSFSFRAELSQCRTHFLFFTFAFYCQRYLLSRWRTGNHVPKRVGIVYWRAIQRRNDIAFTQSASISTTARLHLVYNYAGPLRDTQLRSFF